MYIKCQDLTYSYFSNSPPIFQGIGFNISEPGFYALFGLSGVGKSTLARLLTKRSPVSSGVITGKIETDLKSILYAHDSERLPEWIPIKKHLYEVTPLQNHGLLNELIESYGLRDVMAKRFSSLSMGQKNRVNLIRYLLQNWDMLITDEVLANVDEPTRYTILYSIKRLFPNRILLYISHNAIEVVRFSKRIFILPQMPAGATHLFEMPGLNQYLQPPDEKQVQLSLYELLRTASCGVKMEDRRTI